MVDPKVIDEAARRLLEAAPPGSKVFLFGSYARGQADDRSDVDFLVVEAEVNDQFGEMVRLRHAIGDLPMSVDVIVESSEQFDYWKDTRNTLPYRVLREGRVYEQVS